MDDNFRYIFKYIRTEIYKETHKVFAKRFDKSQTNYSQMEKKGFVQSFKYYDNLAKLNIGLNEINTIVNSEEFKKFRSKHHIDKKTKSLVINDVRPAPDYRKFQTSESYIAALRDFYKKSNESDTYSIV